MFRAPAYLRALPLIQLTWEDLTGVKAMVIAVTYWVLFSVVLSLMHLLIGILIWHAKGRAILFHNLFSNGSLLFFAAALTAKSFGDYYRNVSATDHPLSALFAFVGLVFVLLPTTAIYGGIVSSVSGGSQHDFPPEVIARYSGILAALAVIYGFTNFLLVLNLK